MADDAELRALILDDLEWRTALDADTLAGIRTSVEQEPGNIVELLTQHGVALSEALAAASSALGLPMCPPRRLDQPTFEGWDLSLLRRLQAVPVGKRGARPCLAFADPLLATRGAAEGLVEHAAFVAAPDDIRRALGEGNVEITKTALGSLPSAPDDAADRIRDEFGDMTSIDQAADLISVVDGGESAFETAEGGRIDIHGLDTQAPQAPLRPPAAVSRPLPAPPLVEQALAGDAQALFEETHDASGFTGDTEVLSTGFSSEAEQPPVWPALPFEEPTVDPRGQALDDSGEETLEAGHFPRPVSGMDAIVVDGRTRPMPPASGSSIDTALDPAIAADAPLPPEVSDASQDPPPLPATREKVATTGASSLRALPGLEQFLVEEVLGRSALYTVYRCRDARTSAELVVKRLAAHLAEDADVVERFRHGVEVGRGIHSRHVVAITASGVAGGVPWCALERCTQGSLAELGQRVGRLPVGAVLPLMLQTLEGVQAVHRAGHAHGDLKPENLLLTRGELKVADVGISKNRLDDTGTRTGRFLGSPAYLAPEILAGGAPSAASDLYSLGCLFFEAMAGAHPHGPGTVAELVARIRTREPPSLLDAVPAAPLLVDRVFAGLMARAPSDRYVSADAVIADLEPLVRACDPSGECVRELADDGVQVASRLSREQAQAEVRHAEAALSVVPPRPKEAAFRLCRAHWLHRSDRRLRNRRDEVLAGAGLKPPPADLAQHMIEVSHRARDAATGQSGPASRLRDEAEATLGDGDLFGGLALLRRYLRTNPLDGAALGLMQSLVGNDPLAPFSVAHQRSSEISGEGGASRRQRILKRPKF